jgi:hypothetical protein
VSPLSDTTFRVASFQSEEAGTLVRQEAAATSFAGFRKVPPLEQSEMRRCKRGEMQVNDR